LEINPAISRYDVVVIGAGLGGLTAAAILARAGRKVLVVERSNSVGGAASSYKVGDLFVEGSLHETSDPRDVRDPKHAALSRAGVLDAVTWVPSGIFYEVRGGPIAQPLALPDRFDGARDALIARFPHARDGIEQILREMAQITADPAALAAESALSLHDKFTRLFGDDEAVKCALAANLIYYHDDPATLSWLLFARAQGHYLQNGACFVHGGSQRLSSALARAIKTAGGAVILRRRVTVMAHGPDGVTRVTHTAKDGSDPQTVEAACVVSNAAPDAIAALLPPTEGEVLRKHYAAETPSISLFALTLGLSRPPREFGVTSYSTQLLPDWLKRLEDFAEATTLLAGEPNGRIPPLAIVDYAAIDSGVPRPPYVLSVVGPDRSSNWEADNADAYRAKRERWQGAIVAHLDAHYPGLGAAVTAGSFNTALSIRQYLGTTEGSVYGFAPTPAALRRGSLARTPIPNLYLASAYTEFGGYSGVIAAAAACADTILQED
jgi:phytoene dehydrogenase-like protein